MGTDEAPKPGWLQTVVIGRNPKRTLLRMVITATVLVVVSRFVLLPIRVKGISMLPTYSENGVNVVNRLAYSFSEPKRGDVVAIRYAGVHLMLMKRIVGLPGESIGFKNGKLLVNGKVLDEPYLKLPSDWNLEPELIGQNQS